MIDGDLKDIEEFKPHIVEAIQAITTEAIVAIHAGPETLEVTDSIYGGRRISLRGKHARYTFEKEPN